MGGSAPQYITTDDLKKLTQIELASIMSDSRNSEDLKVAVMAELMTRNFMFLENGAVKAASSVKSLVNSVKKAIVGEKAVNSAGLGIIKNFNMNFLLKEKEAHVFSGDHIKNGIMDLGKNFRTRW